MPCTQGRKLRSGSGQCLSFKLSHYQRHARIPLAISSVPVDDAGGMTPRRRRGKRRLNYTVELAVASHCCDVSRCGARHLQRGWRPATGRQIRASAQPVPRPRHRCGRAGTAGRQPQRPAAPGSSSPTARRRRVAERRCPRAANPWDRPRASGRVITTSGSWWVRHMASTDRQRVSGGASSNSDLPLICNRMLCRFFARGSTAPESPPSMRPMRWSRVVLGDRRRRHLRRRGPGSHSLVVTASNLRLPHAARCQRVQRVLVLVRIGTQAPPPSAPGQVVRCIASSGIASAIRCWDIWTAASSPNGESCSSPTRRAHRHLSQRQGRIVRVVASDGRRRSGPRSTDWAAATARRRANDAATSSSPLARLDGASGEAVQALLLYRPAARAVLMRQAPIRASLPSVHLSKAPGTERPATSSASAARRRHWRCAGADPGARAHTGHRRSDRTAACSRSAAWSRRSVSRGRQRRGRGRVGVRPPRAGVSTIAARGHPERRARAPPGRCSRTSPAMSCRSVRNNARSPDACCSAAWRMRRRPEPGRSPAKRCSDETADGIERLLATGDVVTAWRSGGWSTDDRQRCGRRRRRDCRDRHRHRAVGWRAFRDHRQSAASRHQRRPRNSPTSCGSWR